MADGIPQDRYIESAEQFEQLLYWLNYDGDHGVDPELFVVQPDGAAWTAFVVDAGDDIALYLTRPHLDESDWAAETERCETCFLHPIVGVHLDQARYPLRVLWSAADERLVWPSADQMAAWQAEGGADNG